MLIFSQNLINYGMPIPDEAIYRINLAWINNLSELKELLAKHKDRDIFIDLPKGRTKPPNNNYSLEEIIPILKSNKNIKFFAISNVDSSRDLNDYLKLIPENITLIPKIESPEGVKNIEKIIQSLPGTKKIIMLDHDDLFSKLVKQNESPENFKEYIDTLKKFCDLNGVILLRTIGVVFSDSEKRVTQYIG